MTTVVKISEVEGTAVPVPGNDIDTDRIVPARYLKEITFTNMGAYAFYDERQDESGNRKNHPFNDTRYSGAGILIVNKNFGCGSSREHAPQALLRFGIKAILGESFAEIFAGNCTVLGIPTATADESGIRRIMDLIHAKPQTRFRLSLTDRTLTSAEGTFPVVVSDFVRKALTEGTWDSTHLMLSNLDKVKETAKRLPYLNSFSGGSAR